MSPEQEAERSDMNKATIDAGLDKAKALAGALLTEHWPDIIEAVGAAYIAAAEADAVGKTWAFPVGLTVKLAPAGSGLKVQARIAWTVGRKDETGAVIVDGQKELPLDGDGD